MGGCPPLFLGDTELSTKEASVKREPATAITGAVLTEGRVLNGDPTGAPRSSSVGIQRLTECGWSV